MAMATFTGTYLAVMIPFIRYCRRKWQDRGWPMGLTAEGIQYTGSRKDPENGQRPFKPKELERLFQGPEMAEFAKDQGQAHKFWMPHVGLFTGARVNELCQLNPQVDIRQDEGGIWYLDITDESEGHKKVDKSVKTGGSKRTVPIHPQLIKLGFLQYVEHAKQQGHTLLFQGFPPFRRQGFTEGPRVVQRLLARHRPA
jgi:integrase